MARLVISLSIAFKYCSIFALDILWYIYYIFGYSSIFALNTSALQLTFIVKL